MIDELKGPHSINCNLVQHIHGNDCKQDCPTCQGRRPAELARYQIYRTLVFLKELEKATDIPMHHQADILQFRCEVLNDWRD